MNRRAFLAKTTIAAAGLCALPLMAQTDLTLDIWEDTADKLEYDIFSEMFPHAYHHRGCGHVTFFSDHRFDAGESILPDSVRLPNGRKPRRGELFLCTSCGATIWPHRGDLYIGSPDED